MVSRYGVSLNNVSMASIDENLLILNVKHEPPVYKYNTHSIAGKQGSSVSNRHKEAERVTIDFEIHVYAIDDRQEVLQDVIRWAKDGGVLEVNDRDGQQLVCICESIPSIDSVRDWTNPLSITFAAYDIPYWQDKTTTTLILEGEEVSGTQAIGGNGDDCYVKCTVVPEGTLTSLTVTAGDTTISLTGISVSSTLVIGYVNGVFTINDGSSLLSKRTAASSDDLRVACGVTRTFSVIANVPVTATFEFRSNWE